MVEEQSPHFVVYDSSLTRIFFSLDSLIRWRKYRVYFNAIRFYLYTVTSNNAIGQLLMIFRRNLSTIIYSEFSLDFFVHWLHQTIVVSVCHSYASAVHLLVFSICYECFRSLYRWLDWSWFACSKICNFIRWWRTIPTKFIVYLRFICAFCTIRAILIFLLIKVRIPVT